LSLGIKIFLLFYEMNFRDYIMLESNHTKIFRSKNKRKIV